MVFTVRDMSCDHCKKRITSALEKISGVDKIDINLDKKRVEVTGKVSQDIVRKTIEDAGYTPEASNA